MLHTPELKKFTAMKNFPKLLSLPDELLWEIMLNLTIQEILVISSLTKRFYKITENPIFWREVYRFFSNETSKKKLKKPIWSKSWKTLVIAHDIVKNNRFYSKYSKHGPIDLPFITVPPSSTIEVPEGVKTQNINVAFIGSHQCGKTSLIARAIFGEFCDFEVGTDLNKETIIVTYKGEKRNNVYFVKIFDGSFDTLMKNDRNLYDENYSKTRKYAKKFFKQRRSKDYGRKGGFIRNFSPKIAKNPLMNNMDVVVLCFSVSNQSSFNYLKELLPYFNYHNIILCGCKSDRRGKEKEFLKLSAMENFNVFRKSLEVHLKKKRFVKYSEIVNFINRVRFYNESSKANNNKKIKSSVEYVECSALKNINVKELMDVIIRKADILT